MIGNLKEDSNKQMNKEINSTLGLESQQHGLRNSARKLRC
jgi:hypothetical protein